MAASWLKRGAAAQKEIEKVDKYTNIRKLRNTKPGRFYLKAGEHAEVTFIDGTIESPGMLDCPMWMEHSVTIGSDWGYNFVCLKDEENGIMECVMCEETSKAIGNPMLVMGLSIIDHRKIPSKRERGKVYVDQKRFFVFTTSTYKKLVEIATKQGGTLAGHRFKLSRSGEHSPRVGDEIEFIRKEPIQLLRNKYKEVVDKKVQTIFTPYNYEKELMYLFTSELADIGIGTGEGFNVEMDEVSSALESAERKVSIEDIEMDL